MGQNRRTRRPVLTGLPLLLALACVPTRAALGQDRAGPPRRQVAIGVISGASLATVAARDYTRYEWGLRSIAPEARGRRRTLSYLAALEWPL